MVAAIFGNVRFPLGLAGLVLLTPLSLRGAEPPNDEDPPGPSSATRLKFLQQILRDMKVLFLETDGVKSSFVWARLGTAQVQAKLDGRSVWEVPVATQHEHPTAGDTSIHRSALIPLDLETRDDEESK